MASWLLMSSDMSGAVAEEELKRRKDLDLFDWTGKMGLERAYDKFLQGEHGREIVEVDARERPSEDSAANQRNPDKFW
jgi:cell division protein FtsI/penicillin-binding protein 2